jgi:cytochrome c oxidase cbb3-type subunit III
MKKPVLLISGLLAVTSFAQESAPAEKSFLDDPLNDPMLPYYLVLGLLLVSTLLATLVAAYVFKVVNMLNEQVQIERAKNLGIAYVPAQGWWDRLMDKMNASVPVEKEKDIELDHSYDGIKELDNHLPPWWKWLFYGTIGFAAVYIILFHFSGNLPLSEQEYLAEVATAEEQARLRNANQPAGEAVDENNLLFTNDPALIQKGKGVFDSNPCGSCHRNDGGGNTIGPNLTDEYWIHGGDIKNIFGTIKNGAVEKGMPAWGKAMSPQDLRNLTLYIMSLQGSNPPDAKAPQGEQFKQTTSVKSDSTNNQASL